LKGSKYLTVLIFFCFLLDNCAYYVWKKEFTRDKKADEVLLLSVLGFLEDPNQELFYFLPATSRNLAKEQFLESRFQNQKSNKPKLVFIHGWNPLERDSDPVTSRTRKIDNITGTFLNGIVHYQENRSFSNSTYDLYLFTYRTSNGIVINAEGFLRTLKKTFNNSNHVIVIAHSMGGLVTRAAMKSENYPTGLIDGVITLGSPMYGSPLASKFYIGSQTLVGELSSFLLETQGGADLSYTNNGSGQTKLGNETNIVLDLINENFLYNNIFISFSGVLSPSCSGAETFYYTTACNILTNSSPSFPMNDGIVPENSAFLGGNGLRSFRKIGYDHSMMAFQTKSIDEVKSIELFNEMISQANLLLAK